MKSHKIPDVHAEHPNVVPLIDIIMCLIIFFMLVAKIGVDTGADKKILIPVSIQGIKIKDMGNTLTLNVRAGPVGDDPLVTALVPDPNGGRSSLQEIKITQKNGAEKPLLETLKFFRYGRDRKPAPKGTKGDDNPDFKVIIRGDKDMGYRFLEPVLITCAEAAVANVNFVTETPKIVVTGGAP